MTNDRKNQRFYCSTMRRQIQNDRFAEDPRMRRDGGSPGPAVDQEFEGFRDQTMARSNQITVNGSSFLARRGELLLDAALSNGIDLPFNCRAGHCGTCCVRLVSGEVQGGEGSEPGIVHACQCRIVGDAVIERSQSLGVRTVEGVLSSLRPAVARGDGSRHHDGQRAALSCGAICASALQRLSEPSLQYYPSLSRQSGQPISLVPRPANGGWGLSPRRSASASGRAIG